MNLRCSLFSKVLYLVCCKLQSTDYLWWEESNVINFIFVSNDKMKLPFWIIETVRVYLSCFTEEKLVIESCIGVCVD
jgi:hypothetical protein